MRKFFYFAAIVLLSLMPFASFAANGIDSFEDSDWAFSAPNANGTAEIDATVFHTGSKCLKINVTTAAPSAPWNIFGNKAGFGSVKIGKKYKLKFWCKSDAGAQEVKFGFNVSGAELNADYSSQQGGWVWTRDWEQHEVTFVASRTADVDIYFLGAANEGVIYIDDLSLEEQPMGVNDPGFENKNWWLGGSTVNNTYTNSLGSFTYDNTVSKTGSWSLKINTTNSGNAWDMMAVCGGIFLEQGKEYKVSFWARGDGDGNDRQLTVGLGNGLSFPLILDATTWKQYSFTFVCNAANAGAKDFGFQAGGNNGIIWVDDIEVKEIVPEPFLRYGYETNNLLPVNSGFELGTSGGISTLATGGANATFVTDADAFEAKKSLRINVTNLSGQFWNIQVYTNSMKTVVDHNYVISFWAKANNGQKIDVKMADTFNNAWTNGEKQFTLTNQWKRYFLETTSNVTGTNSALLTFMMGRSIGDYWLDNIVIADMDTLNYTTNLPTLLNTTYSSQLKNADFEVNGLENWSISGDASLLNSGAKNGTNAVRIATAAASALDYNSYIKQTNITLAANKTYLVSFWAKSNNLQYLKSMVASNELPITAEFTTKLSKDWKRYQYSITAPSNWNIDSNKATLFFGASYQQGIFDIDDVIVTNSEATADAGTTTALATISQNDLKCIANHGSIQVFGDNFTKYEIVNLSGQLVVTGMLQGGKAQFQTTINNGLYIAKFTKFDGKIVSNKLLVR